MEPGILISVVIVNYKVPEYLRQAIRSLRHADIAERAEIIVVDNASGDHSRESVLQEFPDVLWTDLKDNIGFSKACNVGARQAHGRFVLFLNPDTLVSKNTLSEFVAFMEKHPEAGIVGPRILNPDGTLQPGCRRSFPTPAIAFYRLFGLSALYPKDRRFGRYNFTYLDPGQLTEVDAVSGSCMFMPLSLFRELGGFDETFFMYGEDLDICARVKERGHKVWYLPSTEIIHFKGKSSSQSTSLKSRGAFYKAMILFSRKYQHTQSAFLPRWIVFLGILLQGGINLGGMLMRNLTACFIDLFIINVMLWASISIRFQFAGITSPYAHGDYLIYLTMHYLISLSFMGVFAYQRIYTTTGYSVQNILTAGLSASVIFMACVYFIKSMAFSRIAVAISSIITVAMLSAWREMLPRAVSRVRRMIYSTGRVIIVGNDDVASLLVENVEADDSASIAGIIWPHADAPPGQFKGYQVLGSMEELPAILRRENADVLLIATAIPWYSYVIKALATVHIHHLTIRWVPHELFIERRENLPAVIPLQDFTV